MEKDFRFKIRKHYKQLRPSERKVADVLLDAQFDVSDLSIEEFSAAAHVSQPTVIRFANAVGLGGYKELKKRLLQDKARRDAAVIDATQLLSFPICPEDKIRDLPAKIISTNIKLLEDTLKSVSSYEYMRAIEALVKAKSIAIFGVENSSCVIEDLATKLIYIGMNCYIYKDPYLQNVSAGNLGKGDVVIGVSYTGCSRHTVDALGIAKSRGATTIAVTNFEKALMNQYSDIVLCSGGIQYMYGNAIFSRCSQMAIVDMLYTGILLTDYSKYAGNIEKSGTLIKDFAYQPDEP